MSKVTFTVALAPPYVNLTQPKNGSFLNTQNIRLNFMMVAIDF